jgi:hypothetical protein
VPPSVAITLAGSTQKVSPSIRVLFQSITTHNSSLQWSGAWLLSDCASDPLETRLDFGAGGVLSSLSIGRNLVIGSGRLVPGGSYRIRLLATTGPVQSTAELLFTVNRLPENGTISVMPAVGTAMETVYLIFATGWQDEDLPLTYVFSSDLSAQLVQVSEPSACNSTAAMLPQGNSIDGFRYQVVGLISDSYDATAQTRAKKR